MEGRRMFQYFYDVKQGDINHGNHVGNERVLLFFQWAREAFLQSLSYSELNIGEGYGIIQKSAQIEYEKQMYLGDRLRIEIADCRSEKLYLYFSYRIYNEREELCSFGETKMLCYDYEAKKVRKIPQEFVEKLSTIREK